MASIGSSILYLALALGRKKNLGSSGVIHGLYIADRHLEKLVTPHQLSATHSRSQKSPTSHSLQGAYLGT